MAGLLDPDGDPILDPDGDPVTDGADSAGLDTGHLDVTGGTLTVPGAAPTLATGHLSLAAPISSFQPVTPILEEDYLDDFNRVDVVPTPGGYYYRNADQWAIVDGALTPTARYAMLLASIGGGGGRVRMSIYRTDANISIFERARRGGFVLAYRDATNYITVTLRASLGADIIEVHERVNDVEVSVGGWTVTGHVGMLAVDLLADMLVVSWQGAVLGTLYLSRFSYGEVGLVGEEDGTDIQPLRLDNWRIQRDATAIPGPMALKLDGGSLRSVADAPVAGLAAAIRGPVVYGPRISQPGTYIPPIVARVYRLRMPYVGGKPRPVPVATLDESFNRTWQDQFGEAGSGSVTLLNDDPDLALIRDGDIVRFELYGEAAFSFVITGREKATIAQGEEHDEVTTLTGPGLLSWITSTMLIYPARQPPAEIHGPSFDRYIAGAPIEEKRVFSWASYSQLVDGDLYGPTVNLGPMPDPLPTENGWPEGVVANRIWVPDGPRIGPVYFRMGFTTSAPDCEIYIHTPLMDRVKVWLDGVLVYESEGGPDNGDVGAFGGQLSWLGTDDHVICVKVDHVDGDAWIAMVGLGIDDEGEFTGAIMGSTVDCKAIAYPSAPPAVTAGAVLGAVLGEMNGRRYNPQLGGTFNDEVDSDGNPWPPLPEVTTDVGITVWAWLQEMADFVEVWMAHNPDVMYAWVAGGRGNERNVTLHGPTDSHDPQTSNLQGLTHRRAT